MAIKLPGRGYVYWQVGTGDSSTVSVKKDDKVIQIDLHHMAKAEDKEEPHWPIVDELEKCLPKKNGKPYLAVFALTHPDKDHIQGFEELLKRITIGEIWQTPRIFTEKMGELCEDAKKFKKEVLRRRDVIMKNDVKDIKSGDRLIVIGHDEIFEKDDYKDFPKEFRAFPGKSIQKIDGEDVSKIFDAFVHAPFKIDSADARNDTSLSLHITLSTDDGTKTGTALFFGDRQYPTIKEIFDKTIEKKRTQYLKWDVMLVSHHCSKKIMYWPDEGEEDEKFKKDIMDCFEKYKNSGAYEIASCESDFTDDDRALPPHKKARNRYEEIIEKGHFICTHEHPDDKKPEPIIFELTSNGLEYKAPNKKDDTGKKNEASVFAAVRDKRGSDEPPTQKVTFG
jgi:hypothetical protein